MADEKRIIEFEPSTGMENDDWFAVDSPTVGTRKVQASEILSDVTADITTISDDMATVHSDITSLGSRIDSTQAMVSEAYDSTATYAVGDYCIYQNTLYVCTTAVESAEAFDSTKWTPTSVDEIATTINSNLADYNMFTNIGTTLASNANLNDITTFGIYNFSGNTQSNIPSGLVAGSSCNLYVLPRGGVTTRVFQIILHYSSTANEIYMRAMTGATSWSAWTKL